MITGECGRPPGPRTYRGLNRDLRSLRSPIPRAMPASGPGQLTRSQTTVDLARNRRFESISLQQRVSNKLHRNYWEDGWETCVGVAALRIGGGDLSWHSLRARSADQHSGSCRLEAAKGLDRGMEMAPDAVCA